MSGLEQVGGNKRLKSECVTADVAQRHKRLKCVKFNNEVYETSFGGTQSISNIRLSLEIPLTPTQTFSDSDSEEPASPQSPSASPQSPSANKPSKIKIPAIFEEMPDSKIPAPSTPVSRIRKSYPDLTRNDVVRTPDCFNSVQMGTPLPQKKRWSSSVLVDTGDIGDEDRCSVMVAVRVRPFSKRELEHPDVKNIVSMTKNETIVNSENGQKYRFVFDFSFWSFDEENGMYASQQDVYDSLAKPQLIKAFDGYNTCLFAYGQTGSGKSYCITGHGDDAGIIPRFGEELFRRRDCKVEKEHVKVNVEISFFEIYNEKIHDLLAPSGDCKLGQKPILRVREHPVLGPYVEGLSSYVVSSYDDMQMWMNLGNKQRATASTGMNDKSSRSHSVFTVVLTQTRSEEIEGEDHEHSTTSKINLIDLAGSERQTSAKTSGDRLKEGASINKSLMTLGKVISTLSDIATCTSKKKIFIPYRDSILTWLLRESLGGNSQTAMLATISPANICMDESLSTLRYAKQARYIVNNAKINEDPKARLIRELRAEIIKLRGQTGSLSMLEHSEHHWSSLAEIASLKEKLQQKENEMMEVTRTWQEKLTASEARRQEEERLLEKSGIALKIDNRQPFLVNLNEDPQLSETLLYILRKGQTRVGRRATKSDQEIQLRGALIADDHCMFDVFGDKVYVSPIDDSPTYVNGEAIGNKVQIRHGDRVILGGDHYFRFNHPIKGQNKDASSGLPQVKDFDFARRELIKAQNNRMQCEIDKMKSEMEKKLIESRQEAEVELNQQRNTFEEKVSQLEEKIKEHYFEKEQVDKLEQQNQVLQQQLLSLANKRKLESKLETEVACDANVERSRIVEMLERQKQKMADDVQRLTALKHQREISTPTKEPLVDNQNRMDIYRTTLLVREANKIGQHLKKHTVFSIEEAATPEIGSQTLVRVTNAKLEISTFWSLSKFEDKLIQMRELYDGDCCEVNDGVFYDPDDAWEMEDRLNVASPLSSDRRLSVIRRSISPRSPLLRRKSSDRTQSLKSVDEEHATSLDLCRELISKTFETIRVHGVQESVADHILHHLHVMHCCIQNVTEERSRNLGTCRVSGVVHAQSLELTVNLRQLVSMVTVWAATVPVASGMMKLYIEEMLETLKSLGNQMTLFLQGCGSDIDSMVNESTVQMTNLITNIAKQCGEMALVSETPINCLSETQMDTMTDELEEGSVIETGIQNVSLMIRQSVVNGCELFLDKTLHGGLKTMEESLFQIQSLVDRHPVSDGDLSDIVSQSEVLVASTRILLAKLQEIQVIGPIKHLASKIELDTSVSTEIDAGRADTYWEQCYSRCKGLIADISCLADHVAIIQQSLHAFITSEEKDTRKLLRSVELIKTSTEKIQTRSITPLEEQQFDKLNCETSDTSILSDTQTELLDLAAQEVLSSADSFANFLRDLIASNANYTSPTRIQRFRPNSGSPMPSSSQCSSAQRRLKTIRLS